MTMKMLFLLLRRTSQVTTTISSQGRACLHSSPNLLGRGRWVQRQMQDRFCRDKDTLGYRSRAAFKLIELHTLYSIFKPGQTVIDLGFAPGAWSQVAQENVGKHGRVLGVDIIPAVPPPGVSAIIGNFLDMDVRRQIKDFLLHLARGRKITNDDHSDPRLYVAGSVAASLPEILRDSEDKKLQSSSEDSAWDSNKYPVHVILSDMCAPLYLLDGWHKNTIINPYRRMSNMSGIGLRDHANSITLCETALSFSADVLSPQGNFVCKVIGGSRFGEFERKFKLLFSKSYRTKPPASRKESAEIYLVGINRLREVKKHDLGL